MRLKKIAFTVYPVSDMERARDFYENILGLQVSNVFQEGAWVEYDLPEGGCFALTTMVPDAVSNPNAGGNIAIEVDDIEGVMAMLKSKGVTVKAEIFESPVCHISAIIDSEGNALMLHQVKRGA